MTTLKSDYNYHTDTTEFVRLHETTNQRTGVSPSKRRELVAVHFGYNKVTRVHGELSPDDLLFIASELKLV